MQDRAELRRIALAAATAAGEVVRRAWPDRGATEAEAKDAGDYVTGVDRAAERAALTLLAAATPGISVLSEEAGGDHGDRGWVVDPVDGTTNLIRRFPVVGVSVALVELGRPVAGAVVAPLLGEWWTAAAGEGAHDSLGRRLHVTDQGRGVVATGFPFRRRAERLPRYEPVLRGALRSFEDLRRAGAASLDLAYVAAGAWDGFFELGLSIWDIAAGALLVREAGGVVTDWEGDPDAVLGSGDILAGSPAWHARMREVIAAS